MTNVTINKMLTVIQYNDNKGNIASHKLGKFETVLNQFQTFVFTGLVSESKFKKYFNKLVEMGYIETGRDWFNVSKIAGEKVVSFKITVDRGGNAPQ